MAIKTGTFLYGAVNIEFSTCDKDDVLKLALKGASADMAEFIRNNGIRDFRNLINIYGFTHPDKAFEMIYYGIKSSNIFNEEYFKALQAFLSSVGSDNDILIIQIDPVSSDDDVNTEYLSTMFTFLSINGFISIHPLIKNTYIYANKASVKIIDKVYRKCRETNK